MARTKQTARKGPAFKARRIASGEDNTTLLHWMGFPARGGAASAQTVQPNWPAVIERLQSHPEEAAITATNGAYPLFLALANESHPLTKEALAAFLQAYPELVTMPRSQVLCVAYQNPKTRTEIIDMLLQANPYLLRGPERTRTFQIMGFPALRHEPPVPLMHYYSTPVDWAALETHLQDHPEEAKIVNPGWEENSFIFALEAALHFSDPTPIPLSTVQLLLRLCPEAVTIADSSALYMACVMRRQEDPQVIRAILNANPALAASNHYYLNCIGELGLPITEAVHLPCAAEIIPDLIRANPRSLSSENQVGATPLLVATGRHDLPTHLLQTLLEEGHRHKVGAGKGGQLFSGGEYHVDNDDTAMSRVMFRAALHREDWEGVGRQDTSWQNFCLCLKAAGAFCTGLSADNMWEYPLLHGVIEFGTWVFFEKIFHESNTDDLSKVDALGRTPLHVAIERAGKLTNEDEDDLRIDIVIQMLVDDQQGGFSRTANTPIDGKGTLPLHYALKLGVGWEDGLFHILNAFSGALAIPDPGTNLIPCLLAAVSGHATSRVSTIFGLMMERPNLIANLCLSSIANGDGGCNI